MKCIRETLLALAMIGSLGAPACADWLEMPAERQAKVAKGTIKVTPVMAWNRSSARPSRRSEAWTRDGINLNELTFYGAINDGESILRQGWASMEKLPRFKSDMLPTDIAELFENTNRMVLQSSVFKMGKVEPAKLGTHNGVRFSYSYSAQEADVERKGEATAAIVDGKLYLVNYVAPSLHYFDAYLPEVRKMIETAVIVPPEPKVEEKGKKKQKKSAEEKAAEVVKAGAEAMKKEIEK
jgi:hypothetical protein